MVNLANTELVARCIPLAVQPATISQNSATNSATMNATNSLKALANAVLERNRPCNHTATDTPKPTQLLPANNSVEVALVAPQLQGVLPESHKQKISAWVRSLGGSEQKISDMRRERGSERVEMAVALGVALGAATLCVGQAKLVARVHVPGIRRSPIPFESER